jgi:hypothetical protein
MLIIQNTGAEPLYTFTITRDAAALVEWIPCTEPTRCEGIAPGGHRELPYSEVYGYTPATRELLVYGWNLVPGENGFTVGTMRVVVVRV